MCAPPHPPTPASTCPAPPQGTPCFLQCLLLGWTGGDGGAPVPPLQHLLQGRGDARACCGGVLGGERLGHAGASGAVTSPASHRDSWAQLPPSLGMGGPRTGQHRVFLGPLPPAPHPGPPPTPSAAPNRGWTWLGHSGEGPWGGDGGATVGMGFTAATQRHPLPGRRHPAMPAPGQLDAARACISIPCPPPRLSPQLVDASQAATEQGGGSVPTRVCGVGTAPSQTMGMRCSTGLRCPPPHWDQPGTHPFPIPLQGEGDKGQGGTDTTLAEFPQFLKVSWCA